MLQSAAHSANGFAVRFQVKILKVKFYKKKLVFMESVFVKMWIYVQVWCGSWVRLDCVDFPKLRLPVCGCWVCMRSVNVSVFLHNRKYIAWDCSVVSEPHCSHAQPWRVGHEGKAVPHRGRDQDVGHCLLRHTEAVSRRNPQVRSCANIFFSHPSGLLCRFFCLTVNMVVTLNHITCSIFIICHHKLF